MTRFVEEFRVPGIGKLGIERQEPVNHGGDLTFLCWSNGCGIGSRPTIEEARRVILDRVAVAARGRRSNLERDLAEVDDVLRVVGDGRDTFRLGRFLVVEDG